jgi:hypothetical protein
MLLIRYVPSRTALAYQNQHYYRLRTTTIAKYRMNYLRLSLSRQSSIASDRAPLMTAQRLIAWPCPRRGTDTASHLFELTNCIKKGEFGTVNLVGRHSGQKPIPRIWRTGKYTATVPSSQAIGLEYKSRDALKVDIRRLHGNLVMLSSQCSGEQIFVNGILRKHLHKIVFYPSIAFSRNRTTRQ